MKPATRNDRPTAIVPLTPAGQSLALGVRCSMFGVLPLLLSAGLVAGFVLTYALYAPPRRVAPVVVDAAGRELQAEYEPPAGDR